LDVPVRGSGIYKYNNTIRDILDTFFKEGSPDIIGENKADDTYPVVSAASIIAKVTRDKEIIKLHKTYGNFGSGYPSDPKTRHFLSHFKNHYPDIVRKKWSTCNKVSINKIF